MNENEFIEWANKLSQLTDEQKLALANALVSTPDAGSELAYVPYTARNDLFDKLWENHPAQTVPDDLSPCRDSDGNPNHDNQCVIRLGMALIGAGKDLRNYPGQFCWSPGHGKNHPLRVEEMKNWLSLLFGPADISVRRQAQQRTHQHYLNKKGIVACINFWGPGHQGDHIDLWNGQKFAHGSPNYFERSEGIWFWKM